MSTPKARSAVKFDFFADAARKCKIETLGDPLQIIARHIDFAHLTQIVDQLLPRGDASKSRRPPYSTEVMVRIVVLKHLYNLSDEQAEHQLLERMSCQRFCLLPDSANIPDRNTMWHYQQRLGAERAAALFQALDGQLLRHGYMARCGQIIDAALVPAPSQHFTKADKKQLGKGNTPSNWSEAKRRQKDLDATHTFPQIRHMGGQLIRTIGQARATVAMTMMAACYNLKRLTKFLDDGVDALYKIKPLKTEVRLQGANA